MAKKIEVRVVQLEDGQKAIMDQLVKMDGTLENIDHVVRGNGAPGLTTKMSVQDERIRSLEKARKSWRELIVLIVSGGIVALLTEVCHYTIHR